MMEHTPEEWAEFCKFYEEGDGRVCLYVNLTFRDGTFHLSPRDAKEKVVERFNLWLTRKRGWAQAKTQFTLIQGGKAKAKPKGKPKLDLSGLNFSDLKGGPK